MPLDPVHRFWEVWKYKPGHAEECLKGWGDPNLDFKTRTIGQRGKRHRTIRTAKWLRGKTVLDVGCGVGHLFGVFKDKVDGYLGIDSEPMIELARKCFPEHQDKFQVGDIFDLSGEFGWGKTKCGIYDTVFNLQVVQHLPILRDPLQEMWNHARMCVVLAVLPPTQSIFTIRDDGLISHRYNRREWIKAINSLSPPTRDYEIHDERKKELPDESRSAYEQTIVRINK